MGVVQLTDHNRRTDFFQQTVRLNLAYWQNRLAETEETAVAALDKARTAIVRAILFGLEMGPAAWPDTHPLIDRFSPFMERRGYWETWHTVLRRAVESAQAAGDEARLVQLTALLARLLFQQSRFNEARHSYRRTIRLARTIGDRFNEARACSNLGYHYAETGHWHRSEVLCCHALTLFEELDSNHGRAHTHNHLGLLYIRRREADKAQQNLEKACTLWEAMGDIHGLMRGCTNLGLLYTDVVQVPDKALFYLTKSLRCAEKIGDQTEIGTIHTNIGFAHTLDANLSQAEIHTHQAETIFRRLSNSKELANVLENLALIYLKRQSWTEAVAFMEEALAIRQTLGHKPDEIQAILYLAEYELAGGNGAEADQRLRQAEDQLRANPHLHHVYELQAQVTKLRRRLARSASGKPAAL